MIRPVFSDSSCVIYRFKITQDKFWKEDERIMKEIAVTITGMNYYYGKRIFCINDILRCKKEPDNAYDAEAIQVSLPLYGCIGYIANSTYTMARGTISAGRLYDQVKKKFYIRVKYICSNQIICTIEEGSKEKLEELIQKQMKSKMNDGF